MTQKNYWNYSTKELEKEFNVTENGLSDSRVEEILREKGENVLMML